MEMIPQASTDLERLQAVLGQMDMLAFIACLILAGWTVFMYLASASGATLALLSRKVSRQYLRERTGDPGPVTLERIRRNYNNLCEMPTLFYAGVALAYATATMDLLQGKLALAYVIARIVHSVVHVAGNVLTLRFIVFTIAAGILVAFWTRTAFALLG